MRFNVASFMALLAALTVVGCGAGGHEGAVQDMLEATNDVAEVLAGITDQASAQNSVPELRSSLQRLVDVTRRAQEMDPPSEAEDARLQEEYGEDMVQAAIRLQDEMMRVAQIPGAAEHIQAALPEDAADLMPANFAPEPPAIQDESSVPSFPRETDVPDIGAPDFRPSDTQIE